jgi:hypothetical protein
MTLTATVSGGSTPIGAQDASNLTGTSTIEAELGLLMSVRCSGVWATGGMRMDNRAPGRRWCE